MKIYLASSWKNQHIVRATAEELRKLKHDVDDFTDPSKGRFVFSWLELPQEVRDNLNIKTFLYDWRALKAYDEDRSRIDWADAEVCLMKLSQSFLEATS